MKSLASVLAAFLAFLALVLWWPQTNRATPDDWPPAHSRLVVKTQQGEREYVVHLPSSYDPSQPTPLVIMLHGFGGTALNAATETGWSAKADQESFIIAYPEATRPDKSLPPNFRKNPQAWNDGSGRFQAAVENVDDVAFIEAMLDQLSEAYTIDAQRIYATGFSNGASMTFRLGAELSDRLAAIAPVAGTSWMENPQPSPALSLCYVTGTADSLNPMAGGYPKLAWGGREQGGKPKPAVQAFVDRWAKSLQLPGKPRSDEMIAGVRKRVYASERQKGEIVFITVEGLGHHWPGGVSQAPKLLVGEPSQNLKATELVWEFFQAHPGSQD
jgi:polyhydroxybutyrate depolymerase